MKEFSRMLTALNLEIEASFKMINEILKDLKMEESQ